MWKSIRRRMFRATAAKTAYIAGFSLVTGAEAVLRFCSANTAGNPTLNVSSTGAKAIYYGSARIPTGYIRAGSVIAFRYSGSYWYVFGELTQAQIDEISQKVKNTSLLSLGTANGVTVQVRNASNDSVIFSGYSGEAAVSYLL